MEFQRSQDPPTSRSNVNVPVLCWMEFLTKMKLALRSLPCLNSFMGSFAFGNSQKLPSKKEKQGKSCWKKLWKNKPKIGFTKAKDIYKQFISKVEKGNISWCNTEETDRIETCVKCSNVSKWWTTAWLPLGSFKFKRKNVWCKDYNKGTCSLPDLHKMIFQGKPVKVHHICKTCYNKRKSLDTKKLIHAVPAKKDSMKNIAVKQSRKLNSVICWIN